jgi:hypothetical protein
MASYCLSNCVHNMYAYTHVCIPLCTYTCHGSHGAPAAIYMIHARTSLCMASPMTGVVCCVLVGCSQNMLLYSWGVLFTVSGNLMAPSGGEFGGGTHSPHTACTCHQEAA